MNAYTKQQLMMKKLGITSLSRVQVVGTEATWLATFTTGEGQLVKTHSFATETGALRELAKILKPVML